MRAWTLVIAAMLSVAGVAFDSALSQEALLQRVDRALLRICEARKNRLDDREQAMWRRRRELVDALDEAQRAQLRRTSPLDEACLQLIGRLAEARRPQFSGYAHRRYYRPGGEGPQPSMEPRAQARMGLPPVPQNAPPPPTVAPAPSARRSPARTAVPMAAADALDAALLLSRRH